MVFSSIVFLFRFLPIALIVYYLTPNKYKNLILTILSLVFYSWGEGKYFLIMIVSIIVDYTIGILIDNNRDSKTKSRIFLCISIFFNLGMLFVFKYFNFFIDNINLVLDSSLNNVKITLPLGISFYTFQTMSYSIDVFYGKINPEKNIINFAAFVTLFPQLIAGPIVKYSDIEKEIKFRKISFDMIEDGIETFILGLGSKVLIANNIGMLWTEIEKIGFGNISTIMAWISVLAFSLQIYFDFSGYSLMAIGIGKMLGFNFPRNFNYPYVSRSISEFWRRWHITLGNWFKEYVYIPLGGNRRSKLRNIMNLFIVWFLTGLWHGASFNFIIWGVLFFILISIEKLGFLKILNRYKLFSHIYTLFFLSLGWAVFAITDIKDLYTFFVKLFKYSSGSEYIYYLNNYGISIVLGIILSLPVLSKVYYKLNEYKWIKTILLISIFIICVGYLVDATYNPFLYFRF